MKNTENPFKFGSIVEGAFFTDREDDIKKSLEVINSSNHLVLISPRRYGKSSMIHKAVKLSGRPSITVNLQLVTSANDLAAEILKRVFKAYPFEKVKQLIRKFRFIPTISLNPLTNNVDLSFTPAASPKPVLEDVLMLIEGLGKKGHKPIVVLDEFQEIRTIDKNLDKILRSVIQTQNRVNYIFMGSQESLMREIFEQKKSPFYHIGSLQTLEVIPHKDFMSFLKKGFSFLDKKNAPALAEKILEFTQCHPYYTQQLAFHFFNAYKNNTGTTIEEVAETITRQHDIDFERLWMSLNLTDRKLILELLSVAKGGGYTRDAAIPTSTRYSVYKKLLASGFLIQNRQGYAVEDPFFARWVWTRRQG